MCLLRLSVSTGAFVIDGDGWGWEEGPLQADGQGKEWMRPELAQEVELDGSNDMIMMSKISKPD